MLRHILTSKFLTWASRSLLGNIVLFEILVALPTFIAFSYLDYEDGILTSGRSLLVGSVCVVEGIVLGTISWFCVTRPAINRKSN